MTKRKIEEARSGAGRPKKEPKEYSDEFKNTLLMLFKKSAGNEKDFGDVFAELLYDRKRRIQPRRGYSKSLEGFGYQRIKADSYE